MSPLDRTNPVSRHSSSELSRLGSSSPLINFFHLNVELQVCHAAPPSWIFDLNGSGSICEAYKSYVRSQSKAMKGSSAHDAQVASSSYFRKSRWIVSFCICGSTSFGCLQFGDV
jgi:hypothetical protein